MYSIPSVFSAAKNTHRDSQNWIEKRRRREEVEVIWGEKGESKGGVSDQTSNHTPESKWVLKVGFLNAQN